MTKVRWLILLAGGLSIAALTIANKRARHVPTVANLAQAPKPTAIELHVPHAKGAIVLDGELTEHTWLDAARTNAFVWSESSRPKDASLDAPARPYSDARLMWGDGQLYLALYAADEDIRSAKHPHDASSSGDSFQVSFRRGEAEYALDVFATGELKEHSTNPEWRSGTRLAHDLDGTLDEPGDEDEEWVIEMAIPLASLGWKGNAGERIELALSCCDTPHHGPRVCAGFGEGAGRATIILDGE